MAKKDSKAAQLLDASRNVQVNPVRLPDGRVVSWAEAFPRPEFEDRK